MSDNDPYSPDPEIVAAAEIVALRYVLALARNDREVAGLVRRDMSEFEPGVAVGVLASSWIDFVTAGTRDGSNEVAVVAIERWLQTVLDEGE